MSAIAPFSQSWYRLTQTRSLSDRPFLLCPRGHKSKGRIQALRHLFKPRPAQSRTDNQS